MITTHDSHQSISQKHSRNLFWHINTTPCSTRQDPSTTFCCSHRRVKSLVKRGSQVKTNEQPALCFLLSPCRLYRPSATPYPMQTPWPSVRTLVTTLSAEDAFSFGFWWFHIGTFMKSFSIAFLGSLFWTCPESACYLRFRSSITRNVLPFHRLLDLLSVSTYLFPMVGQGAQCGKCWISDTSWKHQGPASRAARAPRPLRSGERGRLWSARRHPPGPLGQLGCPSWHHALLARVSCVSAGKKWPTHMALSHHTSAEYKATALRTSPKNSGFSCWHEVLNGPLSVWFKKDQVNLERSEWPIREVNRDENFRPRHSMTKRRTWGLKITTRKLCQTGRKKNQCNAEKKGSECGRFGVRQWQGKGGWDRDVFGNQSGDNNGSLIVFHVRMRC